jgi:hypothetical protein
MAHTNLGHALAATDDTPAAVHSFRRALRLSPDREVEEETRVALARLGVTDPDDEEDAGG